MSLLERTFLKGKEMKTISRAGRHTHARCSEACMFFLRLGGYEAGYTANKLAVWSGYSARQCNRVLAELFRRGLVAYYVDKARNGEKRCWSYVHTLKQGKDWIIP